MTARPYRKRGQLSVDNTGMNTALQPTPPGSDPNAANRRRSERKPYVVEAWICSPTATSADEKAEVTALNVSRHGAAFESPDPLPIGSFHIIEIGVGAQRLCSEVRIVSCRATGEFFDIGAEFC